MTSTTDRCDCFDNDEISDDGTLDIVEECTDIEVGQLPHCNSQNGVTNIMFLTEPSMENLSANSLEPYTGMTFQSLDDARDFYYEYAKQIGFTIRTNRIRHSLKNMEVIGRDFVCSREGFRAAKHAQRKDRVLPPRPITREGCKAMIRLAARDGGKWLVTKFVREHNHKLMTHSKFPGELPIVNILNEEDKDKKIQDLCNELQRERERTAAIQKELHTMLKELEEHADFMTFRVEGIINSLKEIELGNL